jgi:hypothetical protein
LPNDSRVLIAAEAARLQKLLESTPLADIASGLGDYYKRLRKEGFTKSQAFSMTYEMHRQMCEVIFKD